MSASQSTTPPTRPMEVNITMERPSKRPRLSMFKNQIPDAELDHARNILDLTLKSKFEAIFEKYSSDFTGIGDEIDITNGIITVNNGHLEGMVSEGDTGTQGGFQNVMSIKGNTLLRAMTVPPENQDEYFDNPAAKGVVMSIEAMAENAAAFTDDDFMAESEDDLFEAGVSREDSLNSEQEREGVGYKANATGFSAMYSSDDDSLFEGDRNQRSSSEDSLFENAESGITKNNAQCPSNKQSVTEQEDDEAGVSNDAILAKFGPEVGEEVIKFLEKRFQDNDPRLEAAWRIPINIGSVRRSTKSATPTIQPLIERDQVFEPSTSVWHVPPKRKPNKLELAVRKRARKYLHERHGSDDPSQGESVEPNGEEADDENDMEVQLAFELATDRELDSMEESGFDDSSADDDYDLMEDVNEGLILNSEAAKNYHLAVDEDFSEGVVEDDYHFDEDSRNDDYCRWCDHKFSCKTSLLAHWDRLLAKAETQMKHDPHDIEMIREIRAVKPRPLRAPRLSHTDFRKIIVMYEAEGKSFDEIRQARVLRTQKTVEQLTELYAKHRSIPPNRPRAAKPWTEIEDEQLKGLCVNPLITMATIKRHLKREEWDIGDRLANGWLREMGVEVSLVNEDEVDELQDDCILQSIEGFDWETRVSKELLPTSNNDLEIKAEAPEDALFLEKLLQAENQE